MFRKEYALLIAGVVVLALLVAGPVTAQRPFIAQEGVTWELSKSALVSTGERIDMPEGVFIKGAVLEARAKAAGGNIVPEGTLRLTFDVFQPKYDLPGQKAGLYYVHGDWEITKNGASIESATARHSPDVARGTIQAELPFNPIETQNKWSALASVPMSPTAGRWSRGQGALTFDERFEGSLYLDLQVWPQVGEAQR